MKDNLERREIKYYWERWVVSEKGILWRDNPTFNMWLSSRSGQSWLSSPTGRKWLRKDFDLIVNQYEKLLRNYGKHWWCTNDGAAWLKSKEGEYWLLDQLGENRIHEFEQRHYREKKRWIQTRQGEKWLKTSDGRDFVVRNALYESYPKIWYDWLKTEEGEKWITTNNWIGSNGWKVWQDCFIQYWEERDASSSSLFLILFLIEIIPYIIYRIYVDSVYSVYEVEWSMSWLGVLLVCFFSTFVISYIVRIIIRAIRMKRWRGLVISGK